MTDDDEIKPTIEDVKHAVFAQSRLCETDQNAVRVYGERELVLHPQLIGETRQPVMRLVMPALQNASGGHDVGGALSPSAIRGRAAHVGAPGF